MDRYIDLRIALEALYLEDFPDERTTQEMRFRLALFGAWHLGDNFKERQVLTQKAWALPGPEPPATSERAIWGGGRLG